MKVENLKIKNMNFNTSVLQSPQRANVKPMTHNIIEITIRGTIQNAGLVTYLLVLS